MAQVKRALVAEVGPRDGFQIIKEFIPTEDKLKIIRAVLDAGVRAMNLTSFVSPKAIPQLADAKEVSETILKEYPGVSFNALVPNLYGARRAAECGYGEVVNVMSVSVTHNLNNINRTHEQSLEELRLILAELPHLKVTAGLATSFGCPFEGETSLEAFLDFFRRVRDLGVTSFELGDTVGLAYPAQIAAFLDAAYAEAPNAEIGVHLHDTRNMGMVNSWVALQHGSAFVQGAVGGLGGCPFAPGATGNVSTEDLVYMLNQSGIETDIDFEKLMVAARMAKELIPTGNFSGHQIMIGQRGRC